MAKRRACSTGLTFGLGFCPALNMAKHTAASALKRSFFIARLMAKLSRSRGAASRPSVKITVICSAKEGDAKERKGWCLPFVFRYARFAKAKPRKEAERRQTLFSNLRTLR